ncbi:MFS transporter [Bremerella cremea]|uniref:MFS transporter n=1 Tax=Bremerella cremea TaxID=1031537 RepID=UPI0031E4F4B0
MTATSQTSIRTSEPAKEELSPGKKTWILVIALTTYLMIVLDISIVIAGLPEIGHDFQLSPVNLSWVQNAYLLCFGGLLLVGARAGDAYGRKRMMGIGLAIFTLASLMIGAAPNAMVLIASRAGQGIGAAILAPAVLSLIATTFAEGEERTKALAWYSMVAGAGASLGLVLGGILTEQVSWRVGFYINVPIGIGLMLAVWRYLASPRVGDIQIDFIAGLASTMGMGTLVFGIVHSAQYGWGDPMTIGSLLMAAVLLGCFLFGEKRSTHPMVPLWLFTHRTRAGAYVARMLFLGAIVSFFFFTTQLLQEVLGYTPMQAGLAFLPVTIPTFIAGMMVPYFTRRMGNGGLLCLSLGMCSAGMFWLSLADDSAWYWSDIALPMIAIGFGNGFALGPLTVAGLTEVPHHHQGVASGVVNVAHQLGGTLGLAILVVVFASAEFPQWSANAILAGKISAATTGGAVMTLFAMLIAFAFVLPKVKPREA